MALTTQQQADISDMCPKSDEYSIGSRLTNITTAGAYDDGTCEVGKTAGTISDGKILNLIS